MKKLISLLAFLLIVSNLYYQKTTEDKAPRDYYLQKSKNQNTAGWILLGTGATMTVIGIIGFGNNFVIFGEGGNDHKANTFGFIMLTGLAMDLASIPVFISASRNKKWASRLEFSNQIIYKLNNILMVLHKQSIPSLTLKISF